MFGVWQWFEGWCSTCASPETPIATLMGERPIADLRVGDLVYSVHERAVTAVPIGRVSSTPVRDRRVVRLSLSNGATLQISPGHPTADGRSFRELVAGDLLDAQHEVLSAEFVPYSHERTYDILPNSTTATYFAAGALVGSTLHGAR